MAKPRSTSSRYFIYLVKAILAVLVILIVGVLVAIFLSSRHNKEAIDAAVNDIKLPSQYQLISSKYVGPTVCVDVCNHTLLTYKAVDSTAAANAYDVTTAELTSLGYAHNSYFYYKTYMNKRVYVREETITPTEFTINVSL